MAQKPRESSQVSWSTLLRSGAEQSRCCLQPAEYGVGPGSCFLQACPEMAEIFRSHGESCRRAHALPVSRRKLMRAAKICRTAELGGHIKRFCPPVPSTEFTLSIVERAQDRFISLAAPAEMIPQLDYSPRFGDKTLYVIRTNENEIRGASDPGLAP